MKIFKFKIGENNYEVSVLHTENNISEVVVNGEKFLVEVEREEEKIPKMEITKPKPKPVAQTPQTAPKAQVQGAKGEPLRSPLPGVILGISVKEGDSVGVGEKLMTLEAMKMENAIKAPYAGTVVKIKVSQGDSVLEGDTLCEIMKS
ncbi:MAG: acetyl-CoA carboxylase biotin carboxyl carrier protein subunit [Bacteroidetes bacterium]|nr:acetyl-CoA carboxylase biotin carboxyl carrier protein subunit [Bacteroidota bacterium]MBU1719500.1 acetyl-CoA carboxylase biotin carboxyl carrier protein subunit [Bacteroidota bacterium]